MNEILKMVKHLGGAIWKKFSGYHRRSLVKSKSHGIKLFGNKFSARDFGN